MPDYPSRAVARLDLGEAMHEFAHDEVNYVALDVFPITRVKVHSANFPKQTRESMLRNEGTLARAKGGQYRRGETKYEDHKFETVDYGYEETIDDRFKDENAMDIDTELDVSMAVTHRLLRSQEKRAKDAAFDTTNFTTAKGNYTDKSATPWSDPTTDVVAHVHDAVDGVELKTGMRPNAAVFSRQVLRWLTNNDKIGQRVVFTEKGGFQALANSLTEIFDLDFIFAADCVQDSGAEGGTFNAERIWGSTYVNIFRTARTESINDPSMGRTFLFEVSAGDEFVIEEYREEDKRSDVLRARQDVEQQIVDELLGHLLKVS